MRTLKHTVFVVLDFKKPKTLKSIIATIFDLYRPKQIYERPID